MGKALIERIPDKKSIRVLARNEGDLIKLKQQYPDIEIMSGDISNECSCKKALFGPIEKVYHLAAFKHIGQAEKDTIRCIESNVTGTYNLLKNFNAGTFLAISTDKAVKVSGVYGASKMLMERMIKEFEKFMHYVEYRIVRYGNVLYSTGSVLCKWRDALLNGKEIIVTEPKATRYFWTVGQAIDLIFECEEKAKDSTPYCPEMKSMSVGDLLEAMQKKYGQAKKVKIIGLQKGENLHEIIDENGIPSDKAKRFTIKEIIKLI